MKRLFKNLLLTTSASMVVLPLVACSQQTQETNTIEILSSLDDVSVIQNQDYLSQPIIAKCFGPDKQEQYLDISFELKAKGFDSLPDWITITDKHEIKVTNVKDVGEFEFSLTAYNKEEKLYSQSKAFTIKVINERHIVPDSISLEIENNKFCMFGEETTIPINIIPYKVDTDQKYLLKDVACDIDVMHGTKLDKNNNPLFYIGGSSNQPTIVVSKDTDSTYNGTYRLKLKVSLISNPTIVQIKDLILNIDNVRQQYNANCKCTFTRSNSDENWTLSSIDSDINILHNIPTLIQNKPVTRIGQNLCNKSKIIQLVEIILPPSIVAIEANAFANQKALCCVEIPGVKYVGESAFENDSLFELRIGSKLPSFYYVGNKAFYNCKMPKFCDQNELVWIGDFAFKYAEFCDFTIGENCYFIGTESFANCSNLNSFKILSENPPAVGGAIFDKCDKLLSIKVPQENVADYSSDIGWSNLGKRIEGI